MMPLFSSRTVSSDAHSVPVTIERTRNRHSRAIYRDETIIVRLGKNLSQREEQAHMRSLVERMTKRVLKERTKPLVDPFRPLLQGEPTATIRLGSGTEYSIAVERKGLRSRVRKNANSWTVSIPPSMKSSVLHRLLWNILAKHEERTVRGVVERINHASFNVPLRSIALRPLSSRWGSCSHRGAITLNAALLFVPEELFTYVIVHELAHRMLPNHSKAFWKCVGNAFPEYSEIRQKLAQFRLLQSL